MSSYSIVPITAEDLPTLAAFVYTSKQQLTINRVLWKDWPNEAAQRANYTNAVEGAFKDPLSETFKVVDDESGEILGHVVLSRKVPVGGDVKNTGTDDEGEGSQDEKVPKGLNLEVAGEVGEAVKEIDKEFLGEDRFGLYISHATSGISANQLIEVTHLFVVMPHRKRGIGSQLVKLCIDKAQAEKFPLVVFSEPEVHGFFLGLGFEDTKHVDIDLRKWAPEYCGFGMFRIWGMVMRN
ncbi:hypothetical protein BP6252_11519 [Coleophoma cylindrospora]|uniref:N-acetyltransferase domain-containing protein n=1 Tax=Coleophoma cylindrospora TaxID=1849047 RepID=A0A3D8QJT7_9HELO|nr:hypothetical protein BP6252_11519 [Coleophoma cylindrospora]